MPAFFKLLSSSISLICLLVCITSCDKKRSSETVQEQGPRVEQKGPTEGSDQVTVAKKLQTELKQLFQVATYTVILSPKGDVQSSIETLLAGGAKLVYDPNNRSSGTIPFYIAELTPNQINDSKFLGSLKLQAASFDFGTEMAQPLEGNPISEDETIPTATIDYTKYIPTNSVRLDQLGEHSELGENVTVAVIDTGVDASHPALKDRVVYWYDATEQTKTELTKLSVSEDSVEINDGEKTTKILLPKALKGEEEIYTATIDESKLVAQLKRELPKKGCLLYTSPSPRD